jgi:hypothetical protein
MKTVIPERRYAMTKGKFSYIWMIPILGILFLALSRPIVVHAVEPAPTPDQGNCISCHEALYFLHDTGNWYCLKESPMSCVDCHGGDPSATAKEQAHLDRAAHPVLNEDRSKCQECHPEECAERVKLFDQTAGISQVLVAAPYTPTYSIEEDAAVSVGVSRQGQQPGSVLIFWEIIPLVLLAGLALTIYLIRRHISIKSTQRRNTK